MSLRVNLKLKFSNQNIGIKVKYNTFEKATFDEYLVCSLILRGKSKKDCYSYIDDITGDGSLNSHFKKLYAKYCNLTEEQLKKIMENSMIPTLKINESGWYNYYPQLDVSVYKNKVYQGDFKERFEPKSMLKIEGEIQELSFTQKFETEKAEPYSIFFGDNGNVKVKFFNSELLIDEELFTSVVETSLSDISAYAGTIHKTCEGEGWNMVTNAVINNLRTAKNSFYNDGDFYLIRNEGLRKTRISRVYGLYVYKETTIPFKTDPILAKEALSVLIINGALAEFKSSVIDSILHIVNDKLLLQSVINMMLSTRVDREWAMRGLNMIASGTTQGWNNNALLSFMKFADGSNLNVLYVEYPELPYTIEQLIKIDKQILIKYHLEKVTSYFKNLEQMKETIKMVIGEVTTSGLRERSKELKSDEDTKKFSKLCNKLIGHENKDLETADLATVEQWHKDAIELKELSKVIEKKLKQ